VLDIGTGTGAIALALATEHPGARVTATDVSAGALALTRENAARLGVELDLRLGDLLAGAAPPFDLVVSNPPYVSAHELAGLEPEVSTHEPRVALLDEGQTARIARARAGEWLVLEANEHAAADVEALLRELGYVETRITPDLNLRPRVVEGRWSS
jgi:release factor glutamine methyltransferase